MASSRNTHRCMSWHSEWLLPKLQINLWFVLLKKKISLICKRKTIFCILNRQIAHMTKSEMGYLDAGLMGPLLLFLNQYFNSFLPEYCVLWIAMIWCTLDLMRYCSQVCSRLHANSVYRSHQSLSLWFSDEILFYH